MRERGLSCRRIGEILGGISPGAIAWHCLRLGADPPKAKPLSAMIRGPMVVTRGNHQVRRFSPEDDAKLLEMAARGAKNAEICRALNRKNNSVAGRLMTLARREERGVRP
jgi:hypothetical protein